MRRRASGAAARTVLGALALAVLPAAATVTADAAKHRVTFTATATGVDTVTPIEFLFVGPDSDRAYEALFTTDDRLADVVKAFDRAGIPRGRTVSKAACRFWPVGVPVALAPDPWTLLKDTRGGTHPAVVFSAGAFGPDGVPEAETNAPSALLSLYTLAQSPLLLNDILDQSQLYGRFVSAKQRAKGERMTFTVSWDGRVACAPQRLKLESGRLKEALLALKSREGELDVLADFSPELTVAEAAGAASALAVVDSVRVKLNGHPEGQFFYRAFLPLEKWRDAKERLVQPLEAHVSATNVVYVITDEDWSVEGPDPKLTPRTVTLDGTKAFKGDTCFLYAPKGMRLARLYAVAKELPETIRNWYVYGEADPAEVRAVAP